MGLRQATHVTTRQVQPEDIGKSLYFALAEQHITRRLYQRVQKGRCSYEEFWDVLNALKNMPKPVGAQADLDTAKRDWPMGFQAEWLITHARYREQNAIDMLAEKYGVEAGIVREARKKWLALLGIRKSRGRPPKK